MSRALLFALLVPALVAAPAIARCVGLPELSANVVEEADFIFAGRVSRVERVPDPPNDPEKTGQIVVWVPRFRAYFEVDRAWRGVTVPEVSITWSIGEEHYREFKQDESYLVFAHGESIADMRTSLCTRTARLSESDLVMSFLGNPNFVRSAATDPGGKAPNHSLHRTRLLRRATQELVGRAGELRIR